jgi:hypothetical protein
MHYQVRAPHRNFSDYRVYYNAGKDILLGRDIYVRRAEAITPFKYSPLFAVFMAPFSIFEKRLSASLFFILNLICLFFIFKISKDLIFFQKTRPGIEYLILFIVLAINFRAILHCLDSGQVGLIIMLLMVCGLFLISREKITAGSSLIGLSVMIKYMPFLFAVYFFLKKRYKITLCILLSVFIYCLLPAIFIGAKTNLLYLKEWVPYITSTSLDFGSAPDVNIKNHSLWSVPRKIFPFMDSFTAAEITALLFLILLFFIILQKSNSEKSHALRRFYQCVDYGMVFICVALFNPNAWLHNFVVLIFPYMLAIYYLFSCKFEDKVVLALVILSFAISSFGSQAMVGKAMQNILERYFTIVMGALLLFASLVKIKLNSGILSNGRDSRNG